MDSVQKRIMIGQAANLSLKHLHWDNTSHTEGEFDAQFKRNAKRFYKLLMELNEEIK
jgi:hypothetical protein